MDDVTHEPEQPQTYWSRHRYLVLIASAIVIALFLVTISMTLYNSLGTAQLDLSRPGFRSVSDQAVKNDGSLESYSSVGTLNEAALNQFKELYNTQSSRAKAVDAFGGDPLNPDILGIGATPTEQP